jgi:hypothetical protein
MKRRNLLAIIVFLLTILFAYAAAVKALAYDKFIMDLDQSPLLTNINKPMLAKAILGFEFLTVVLLHITSTKKWGLYAAFFQLLIFSGYLTTLYFFYTTTLPYASGGILGKMSYPVHIAFDLVCTLLALCGVLLFNSIHKRNQLRVVYNAHALTPAVDYQ